MHICSKAIPRTNFTLNDSVLSSLWKDLIDVVVAAAKTSADEVIRSEGRTIQLEESLDLSLPFLLPEGGYSCDTVRGVPPGFMEFLEPICQKGTEYFQTWNNNNTTTTNYKFYY